MPAPLTFSSIDSRSVDKNKSRTLHFIFQNNAATSGYTIKVEFTNDCEVRETGKTNSRAPRSSNQRTANLIVQANKESAPIRSGSEEAPLGCEVDCAHDIRLTDICIFVNGRFDGDALSF